MRWLLPILLLITAACGPAQPTRPPVVSRMVFAPDDSAVEPPTTVAPSGRPRPHPQPTEPAVRPPADRPAARCGSARGEAPAESVGRATKGRLMAGCLLPRRGPGYVRRNKAGWGTDETVALVQWATGEVARLFRGTAPVVVGALSRAGGGRLRGHRSHQSGRDIDIGYFASNNRALPHFRRMHHGNLDVPKSWALIGALLSTGRVQYVFMDYELQVLFHRYLEEEGVDTATLERIFQFPAGRRARRGIVRHAKGHADHFHVRFRCPVNDRACVD